MGVYDEFRTVVDLYNESGTVVCLNYESGTQTVQNNVYFCLHKSK